MYALAQNDNKLDHVCPQAYIVGLCNSSKNVYIGNEEPNYESSLGGFGGLDMLGPR